MRPLIRRRAAARTLVAVAAAATLACGGDGPTGPRVGDIVLEPASLTLRQKESSRVRATVVDANGTLLSGVAVTFASSNEGVVTVSSIGEVTSVGPSGSAAIRVTAGGLTKNLPVVVQGIATSVRVDPSPATLAQNGTLQLQADVLDLNGDEIPGQPMTYQSSNTGVVTVNPGGLVTAVGPHGTATIDVTSGELHGSVEVTVTQVRSGLLVTPGSLLLGAGRTAVLHATLVDAVGAAMPGGAPFGYTSDNPGVATVDADGTVHAVGPLGRATISVQGGGYSKSVVVDVVDMAHPQGEIAGSIAVMGAFGVSFTRAGVAYAVSMADGIFRLDPDALTATQVASGTNGLDLALTSDGTRAYVASQNLYRVDLVDLTSGSVVQSSPALNDAALTDILGADDQTVWVGTGIGAAVLDASTLALVRNLDLIGTVIHLARHPTLPYMYVSASGGVVYEVDMTSYAVRRNFGGLGQTQGVAVSPDGSELYVADEGGPVHVVDLTSGAEVGRVELGTGYGFGYGLVVSPDGQRLYVSMSQSGKLAIVDPISRTLLKTLAMPGTPRRLAISPDGTILLVANEGGSVTVVR